MTTMANDYHGRIPSRLVIVAGTYDGVLAGWDTDEHAAAPDENDNVDIKLLRRNDGAHLKLAFATAAHEGSVRCIDVAGAPDERTSKGSDNGSNKKKKRQRSESIDDDDDDESRPSQAPTPGPGSLLSGGYDEAVNVFDLRKRSQVGELKTPSDLGSPLCCSFAPPCRSSSQSSNQPTHALVGTTSGKIVLYKKRDWSVQHVLSGHDGGGAGCLAVHPTGRMALSGGRDGKIILWDLVKGRLAYVHKLPKVKVSGGGRGGGGGRKETVEHIVWSDDGARYAYCHGTRITARDAASGEDLLDVDAPARANQLAFVGGPEGMFLAAACDDGGLPVFEVGRLLDDDDAADTRRAIMAIEPADGVAAGDDRLKCIRSVEGGSGFLAVTANSGGVVSLMDLEGAALMMLTGGGGDDDEDDDGGKGSSGSGGDDDDDKSDDSDDEFEAAVEILDSVRIGSGARITDLAVWSHGGEGGGAAAADFDDILEDESGDEAGHPVDDAGDDEDESVKAAEEQPHTKKRMKKEYENQRHSNTIELDAEAVEKARKLVGQAKKRQRKEKKRKKKKEEQIAK